MKRFLRDNCLSAVMFGLSALFVLGLGVAGARERAEDDGEHGRPPSSYAEYVSSGDFGQAVVENWESELLAIGVLLVLSVRLRDRGSPGRSRCPLRTAPPA